MSNIVNRMKIVVNLFAASKKSNYICIITNKQLEIMNFQTIKQNMLNDLKCIERSEITEEQVENALRENFNETLMRSDEEQKLAEFFQDLGYTDEIRSNNLGTMQVGFFEIRFHENYVDSGSDDYVYTYEIHQNEWPGIN